MKKSFRIVESRKDDELREQSLSHYLEANKDGSIWTIAIIEAGVSKNGNLYPKEVLKKVGLIDENYYNAWEHVDHTYCIIKAGYHPPFWWFADLYDSHKYITEAPNAINNSSIANNTEQWQKNVSTGREIYKQKHGHYPNQPPYVSKDVVINFLNIHKAKKI